MLKILILGMAFQALIAGSLSKLGFIELSSGQQLTAGIIFLFLAFALYI